MKTMNDEQLMTVCGGEFPDGSDSPTDLTGQGSGGVTDDILWAYQQLQRQEDALAAKQKFTFAAQGMAQ